MEVSDKSLAIVLESFCCVSSFYFKSHLSICIAFYMKKYLALSGTLTP